MAAPTRPSPAPDHALFDRRKVQQQRDRAARDYHAHDFLHREIAERVLERLDEIKRRFPLALDLGCRTGIVRELLRGRGGVETLIELERSPAMLARASGPCRLVGDEERLPIRDGSLDLVISVFALHWVNDLPGTLIQIRRALKPDGLFLGAILGGDTLIELRSAWLEAELERHGGASPRVAPSAGVDDLGGLLQRAGFGLPVVDTDRITVTYADPLALMRELRAMGETNACAARTQSFTSRATLFGAIEAYRANFGLAEGRIGATFQSVYLTGWAPDASQQKPARRGSGTVSLGRVLGEDDALSS